MNIVTDILQVLMLKVTSVVEPHELIIILGAFFITTRLAQVNMREDYILPLRNIFLICLILNFLKFYIKC